ncbi:MAG: phosphomethylpyrimidine synthase ThiC [Actinobacteria bacterium]|nr:phosphomethylpyrimidine synthase ThiC [Actinomycetota bacterium]MBU1942961.1 phosphomethylpyrimidine synthase ThiC [Actinomycetota bacterium]MBU2687293.1 phosphomethylpyrimidine synthase ThiC [Actinomycetota bacterium]
MDERETLIERLRKGDIPSLLERAAEGEPLAAEEIAREIVEGTAVLCANGLRDIDRPCAIGAGLRTKVNANIGTSAERADLAVELSKLLAAVEAGADTVMDLSTGGDIDAVRRAVVANSAVPVGTVPIYQAAIESQERHGSIVAMTADEMFGAVERHAADGVDFVTVHCGVTTKALSALESTGRVADIVSRGGAFLSGWIIYNERENPLYENFDRMLEIARRYEVTLSLGDGFRPGAVADATDAAQIQELITLGELVGRCREAGVQAMVEGPGHVPLHQVVENVRLAKDICRGAPFYVLGPLVTDVAPGYDHIVAGIGGALAAASGADYLCYVTPREHLGLPEEEDVREGTIVTRIAAHAADLAKNPGFFMSWDTEMSRARKALKWERQVELSLDPRRAGGVLAECRVADDTGCTMCGEFCAMKFIAKYLGTEESTC